MRATGWGCEVVIAIALQVAGGAGWNDPSSAVAKEEETAAGARLDGAGAEKGHRAK